MMTCSAWLVVGKTQPAGSDWRDAPTESRLRSRDVGHAEAHDRRAPASLSERRPSWANAHTRAGLAQMLETTLFEGVVVSFEEPHRHDVREALFVALAGGPAYRCPSSASPSSPTLGGDAAVKAG